MIKKLLFIFLLQMSFATCICAQKVIDWRATRDSIAKHADKFLDVEGLKLKPGLTMKKLWRCLKPLVGKPIRSMKLKTMIAKCIF